MRFKKKPCFLRVVCITTQMYDDFALKLYASVPNVRVHSVREHKDLVQRDVKVLLYYNIIR